MKPTTLPKSIVLFLLLLCCFFNSFSQNAIFNNGSDFNFLAKGTTPNAIGTVVYIETPDTLAETNNPFKWYEIIPPTPPVNDDCSGVTSLTSTTSCITTGPYTLDNATASTGFSAGCASIGTHYDVWFSFTALGTTQTITISSLGTNIANPEIQLFSGNCASLTSVQCGTTTLTATGLTVSTTYYIRVSNVGTDPSGNGNTPKFSICVTHPPTLSLTRGPYLNMGNQTALTFRWRSNTPSDSRVEVGTSIGVYTITADNATSTTEHEVRVTGLIADTKYYYRIGSTTTALQSGTSNFFRTAPPTNTTRKLYFAAFGDCGTNSLSYQTNTLAQYQSYLSTNSIDAPDAWLLMGDNAYSAGTDGEYTSGFFNPYQSTITKNHILFPVPGNHDYANSTSRQLDHAVPYYDIFTLPTAAESGGVASGTEAYYSWNWGNVHFLALDSYGQENAGTTRLYDTTGAQFLWIKNDMAVNTKKWTIAYWHHPPYTMGSHTSNGETELINIRATTIKVLERLGIDLVICGHSHDYERSKLLNGHYGTEVATVSMTPYLKSSSSGFYDGTANSCTYTTASNTPNHGTVYVVAGSSGNSGGTNAGLDGYPHNALPYSINDGGMFFFEVDDNRLNAKFIEENGTIFDKFTIMKDVNKTTNYAIVNGQSKTLSASWPGNYAWSTAASTRSISVTPPNNATTNYTVTDNFGCITDQFAITTSGTLPVIIKEYTVNLRSNKVFVNWITTSEIDNHHFTIERSADARHFESVGIVNGAGNTDIEKSYEFIDASPLEGVSYYRLSQTNLDGTVKYFDIKKIINKKTSDFYTDAYQSGAQMIKMQVYSAKAEKIQLRVIDFNGRLIKNETWALFAGTNNKTMDLKSGSYILEWKKDNGIALTQAIIVK